MVGVVNARPSASTGGCIGAGLRQRMAGLAWHARRTGLDGGRRRLAGDDRFETQIVVMASDSDAVSWLRLGGRFVFDTHCVRGRTGSLCVRVQYELADAGQTYGVNVAVTSVDARNVKFDIKVADQPKP